jgi:septal ring factor EnvC (AmiA/AmiB activator)
MNFTHKTLNRYLLLGSTVVALAATSCSEPQISKEQLEQLRELRKQQTALQDKIKLSQSDIARLESEIADRQKVLAKCNEEKAAIEERLAKWPNSWPDYTPAAADSTAKQPANKKGK